MAERGSERHGHRRHRLKSDAQKQRDRERSRFEGTLTKRVFPFAGLLLVAAAMVYAGMVSGGRFRVVWLAAAALVLLVPAGVVACRTKFLHRRDIWFLWFPFLAALVVTGLIFFCFTGGARPNFFILLELTVVFLSVWGTGSMVHARLTGFQPAILVSLFLVFAGILVYLGLWIFKYFNLIFIQPENVPFPIFLRALAAGFLSLAAVYLLRRMLKHARVSLPKEWFSRSMYRDVLLVAWFVLLYAWGFWIWNEIASRVFLSGWVSLISLAAYTYGYLILTLRWTGRRRPVMLEGILLIATATTLFYPFIIYRSVSLSLLAYLTSGRTADFLMPLILHLVTVILVVYLLYHIYHLLKKHFSRQRRLIHLLQLYILLYFLFLLLTLYHHLTVIQFRGAGNIGTMVADMEDRNAGLPLSLITMGWAVAVLIWSVVRGHRFMRLASVVLFTAAIVKIIGLDLVTITPGIRIGLLLFLGAVLILFALFYPRIRKALQPRRSSRRRRKE